MERPAPRENARPDPTPALVRPPRDRSPAACWILFVAIAAGITAFDLWSKAYFFRILEVRVEGDRIEHARNPIAVIPGLFEWEASANRGAFSGMFSGQRPFLVALSAAALALIVWFLVAHIRGPGPRRLWFAAALGLLWAGTCGNLYDRAAFGYVRDFVKWFVQGSPVQEATGPGIYRLYAAGDSHHLAEARLGDADDRVGFEKRPDGTLAATRDGRAIPLPGTGPYAWRRVYIWPNFNVADSAICVGVGILVLLFLREPRPKAAGAGAKSA